MFCINGDRVGGTLLLVFTYLFVEDMRFIIGLNWIK